MSLTETHSHEAAPAALAASPAVASAATPSRPAPSGSKPRKGVRVDRKMGPHAFKPRKSSPFVERTLVLHSLMAQQLFESTYGRTQVALYNVRYMAPMLADKKTADELAATVKTMLDGVGGEVQEAIAQLRLLREQKGAHEAVAFSDPYTVTVAWFTPSTNAFLTLVQAFDDLMREVETLWMLEHFDDDAKKNLGYEWRSRLIRFARSLMELQGRSLAAVRRKLSKNDPRTPASPAAIAAAEATVAATPAEAAIVPHEISEVISAPEARTETELVVIVAAPAEPAPTHVTKVSGRRAEKAAAPKRAIAAPGEPLAATA